MEMFPLKIYAVCGFIYICLYAFDGKRVQVKKQRRRCAAGRIPATDVY